MYIVTQQFEYNRNQQKLIELKEWFSAISLSKKILDQGPFSLDISSDLESCQTQVCLEQLNILCQSKVNFKVFVEFFKTINLMISCPLTKSVFNLKIKLLYRIFNDLPLILFNEQTCKELAVHTAFFPSAHDIDQIMSKHKKRALQNIELLQGIIQQKQSL